MTVIPESPQDFDRLKHLFQELNISAKEIPIRLADKKQLVRGFLISYSALLSLTIIHSVYRGGDVICN